MANAHYHDVVTDLSGNSLQGASVYIYTLGTSNVATIYSNDAGTTPKANPIVTDSTGRFDFYVAEGHYDIHIVRADATTTDFLDVAMTEGVSGGSLPSGTYFFPGTSTGLATPPTAIPSANQFGTGGTIAGGTYYFKVTGVNAVGETTGSPTLTLVVTAGATNSLNVYANDFTFATGYFGNRIYASNDNVNFYLQTPNPVDAAFMTDTWTHYVKMGSGLSPGFLQSLTFSGTPIPTTNTATITKEQVTVNQIRAAGLATSGRYGAAFIPANVGGNVINTPLILTRGDHLIGVGAPSGSIGGTIQSNIAASGFSNTKLGAVMAWGDVTIEGVSIRGFNTNGFMQFGGAGYQVGFGGTIVKDSDIQAATTAGLYSAYVGVGILYDVWFTNVSMRGDKSIVEYRNIAGGEHHYTNGRWDAGGASYMLATPGWGDPDTGTTSSFFPYGVGDVVVKGIRTEIGNGILWNVPSINLTLDGVQVADSAIAVGTDSVVAIGKISGFGTNAVSGNFTVINCSPGGGANARVGTMVVGGGNQVSITLIGTGSLGVGQSTGTNIALDANSKQLFLTNLTSSVFTMNPNATGNAQIAINVPDNSVIAGGGGGSGTAGQGGQWFEIPDRLVFNAYRGNNDWRRNVRMSMRDSVNEWGVVDNLSGVHVYTSDDTTPLWAVVSSGLMWVRGNARIQATAGGTPQFFIGPSSATSVTGAVALRNNDSINWRNQAGGADIAGWRVNASDEMESQAPLGIMPLANATPLGKTGKTWNLNGFPTATVGTASTVVVRDTSGRLTSKRFIADGTALVAGDFALDANWGAGAAVSAVTGTDQAWSMTITAAGVPVNPATVTLTFKDGTWTNAPICQAQVTGGSGLIADMSGAPTATTWPIAYNGLPVAASTYILTGICFGR